MGCCTPAVATARATTSSTTGRTATRSILAAIRPAASEACKRRRPPRVGPCDRRTSARTATRSRSTARSSASIRSRGQAPSDNPLFPHVDPNGKRVVAYGLRNPFRITARPGTSEIWIGDVGWNVFEEINRLVDPTDAEVDNFGWPCYEGAGRQPGYDSANLTLCEQLYATNCASRRRSTSTTTVRRSRPKRAPRAVPPFLASPSIRTARYPSSYRKALFFSDYCAQLHLGHVCRCERHPEPEHENSIPEWRRRAGGPEDRSGRRSLLRQPVGNAAPDQLLQRRPAAYRGGSGRSRKWHQSH